MLFVGCRVLSVEWRSMRVVDWLLFVGWRFVLAVLCVLWLYCVVCRSVLFVVCCGCSGWLFNVRCLTVVACCLF